MYNVVFKIIKFFLIYLEIMNLRLGLVWFYGISTIVGYLMPNPFYTYIKYMIIYQYYINIY